MSVSQRDIKSEGNRLPIILASGSPRRKQLLAGADVEFDILSVDIDESVLKNEAPQDYIQRMVETKAIEASNQLAKNPTDQSKHLKLIITADTIGVLPDGVSILVKPVNKDDAFKMWSKMSGKSHQVWTAVQLSLVEESGKIVHTQTVLEKTDVEFIELSKDKMDKYWDSGEPQDKAGGYAIQGKGAAWVSRVNGSYTNVVGLPLAQTLCAIEDIKRLVKQFEIDA